MESKNVLYKTVGGHDLANRVKSGSLPVLATPIMIAWMEQAATELPDYEEGWTSVGIHMDVSHDAPTLEGKKVRVEAVLEKTEGKILTFAVSAWSNGVCIGKGEHKRALVNEEKFMARAKKNAGM